MAPNPDSSADEARLAAVFVALGETAADAKHLAQAEMREDQPALARSMFLRLAWKLIIDENAKVGREPAWIEGWLRWARSQNEPQRGVAAALERLLARGIDPDDLTDVVRGMQFELLFNVCNLLDEEGRAELVADIPDAPDIGWRLFEVDSEGRPTRVLEGLHESVGTYDPTGREGDPRNRD